MRLAPRTLRGRLVGASALGVFASLAALSVAATFVVEHQIRDTVDDDLRQRAVEISRLAVSTPELLPVPGTLDFGSGGRQLWVEVRDRRGRIVARSATLGGRLLPSTQALDRAVRAGRAQYADGNLGDEPVRLYAAPLAETGRLASGGAVLLGSSVEDIEDTFTRLRRLVALAALAAAALGALLVTGFTARTLRPLRRLAAGARAISERPEPGRRLESGRTVEELDELGGSLNRMLDALDRARAAERRLLADASHELRTPVTALRGNVAYARRHGADDELLAELEGDVERLSHLVDDLLALEREEGAEPPAEEVALPEVVTAVAGDDARVTVTALTPLAVRGQAGALERALGNLVENARVHGRGQVRVALTKEGDRAVLAVSDDGPGIPPEQAELALRRFWRGPDATAGRRPGSGLGLAIVAAIAARHGGSVRIDGATVAIVLPVVRELSRSGHTVPAP
jgi:two-component system OmpR family sensor kinase